MSDETRSVTAFDPIARAGQRWRERWGEDSPVTQMMAATSIMRSQQLLVAALDEAVAPWGLTFARYEALVLLAFSRAGELPMSKVGERLMIHPTSATNIIQRLDAAGLVKRRPNPADGRGTLAAITPEGVEVMEAATAALHQIEFGLAGLSATDSEELLASLVRLRERRGDIERSE